MHEEYPVRATVRKLKGQKGLVGVEIGVDIGNHALNMLQELDIKMLYLIDPYIVYDKGSNSPGVPKYKDKTLNHKQLSKDKLKDFCNKVVWIYDFSYNAHKLIDDNELDFVYIDGNHTYEYTKKDIDLFYSKVKPGGLISGHDYKKETPGVIRAVNERFSKVTVDGWEWSVIK